MKLKTLIKKLQKLEKDHKNADVVVDFDENGFFNLEKVIIVRDGDDDAPGKMLVNLKSSNEL